MISAYVIQQFIFPFLWNDGSLISLLTCAKKFTHLIGYLSVFLKMNLFTKKSLTIEMSAYAANELFGFRLERHEMYWLEMIANTHLKCTNIVVTSKHFNEYNDDIKMITQSFAYKSGLTIQWSKFMTQYEHLVTQRLLEKRSSLAQQQHIRISRNRSLLAMIYHCFNVGAVKKLQFLAQIAVDVLHARGLAFVSASAYNQTSKGLFYSKRFPVIRLEITKNLKRSFHET